MEKEKYEELAARYGTDLEKMRKEQARLSENLEIEDKVGKVEEVNRVGGIHSVFSKNKIISAMVVMEDREVVDEEYFIDKVRFPYIPGFRAYRELPTMVQAFNKLEIKPDIVFVNAHGILHPRGLGLASHFSLSTNVPTIGVADSLLVGEEKGDDIELDGEVKGRKVETKEGAKPLIVSPGNKVSLDKSIGLVKEFTYEPHKFPEALDKARKYAKKVRKEMFR